MRQVLSSEEIRLLMEVGTVLAGAGKTAPAIGVFDALATVRPSRAFPYVGKAMALINAGRSEEACQCLRRAHGLVDNEAPTIDAFLGLALHLAGRAAESTAVLRRAAVADVSIDGVRMARRMLGMEIDGEFAAEREGATALAGNGPASLFVAGRMTGGTGAEE